MATEGDKGLKSAHSARLAPIQYKRMILLRKMKGEKAGAGNKPGSVIDNHSSGIAVASYL